MSPPNLFRSLKQTFKDHSQRIRPHRDGNSQVPILVGSQSHPGSTSRDLVASESRSSTQCLEQEQTSITGNQDQVQDLWLVAYEQLKPPEQETLKRNKPQDGKSLIAILERVIEQTKHKYEVHEPIRDQAVLIVGAVLKLKAIADKIVAFDPTGYAASAWGLVSMGLTMINNHNDIGIANLEACQYLTDTLARYSCMEELYRNSDPVHGFEDAIVRSYKAVLEYTAAIQGESKSSLGHSILSSATSLADHNLTVLKKKVEDSDSILSIWLGMTEYKAQIEKAKEILAGINKAVARLDAQHRQQILNWLSSETISAIHNEAVESRCDGTSEGLLNHDMYKYWRDQSTGSDLLWIYGSAGMGKTVLCSKAVQNLQELCHFDDQTKLAYWYFRFNNISRDIVSRMLRSFIRQLSSSVLLRCVTELYKNHNGVNTEPTWEELIAVLTNLIRHQKGKVFLVIDGLDECPEAGQTQTRGLVLKLIKRTLNIEAPHSSVRFLLSSRQEPDIEIALDLANNISLGTSISADQLVAKDIELYVESKISSSFSRYPEKLQSLIKETLTQSQEKRFRWVQLQVARLELEGTRKRAEKILKSLPPTLEATYQQVLEQRPENLRQDIRLILMLLTLAYRRLKVAELESAVEMTSEEIRRHCTSSLISLYTENGTLYIVLSHFSVKEYLVSKASSPSFWFQFTEVVGHSEIASHCLSCCYSLNENPLTQAPLPWQDYKREFWFKHAAEGWSENSEREPQILKRQIDKLFTLGYTDSYIIWNDFLRRGGMALVRLLKERSLIVAAFCGFRDEVRGFLTSQTQGDNKLSPDENLEALKAAAIECHPSITGDLLEVTGPLADGFVCYCLERTGSERTKDACIVLKLLLKPECRLYNLEELATVHCEVPEWAVLALVSNSFWGTVILASLLSDDCFHLPITGEIIMAVLKAGKRDIKKRSFNSKDGFPEDKTSILNLKMISLQIKSVVSSSERNYAEVDIPFMSLDEVLSFAERTTFNDLMGQVLDRRGNEVHITQSMLLEAAAYSCNNVMKLLLKHGGDEVQVSEEVLLSASRNKSEVMKVLLEHGGDTVQITEELLLSAAECDNAGVIELFLERAGDKVKITEDLLLLAARTLVGEVMKVLLEQRGDEIVVTADILDVAEASGLVYWLLPPQMLERDFEWLEGTRDDWPVQWSRKT